jgi:hypothetical protein
MSGIGTFRAIMASIKELIKQEVEQPDATITVAREALEVSLNFWVDTVLAQDDPCYIMRHAVAEFSDDQLQSAIRKQGSPIYARILDEVGDTYHRLTIAAIRLRRLSNADIDYLIAKGFDYDGARHHQPAQEWLVRGAAYGEKKFRAKHPRKSPVVAYWEEYGLALPPEGLCAEGAKMIADLLRKDGRLPRKVRDAAERSARSTDWRVALCMRIQGHSFPYTIVGSLGHIYGSKERREAINRCLAPPKSNHEKVAFDMRMMKMPSLEEILMTPRDKENIDRFLEKLDCAPVVDPV